MPQPQDKEVDFSNFFKNQAKNNKPASTPKTVQKRISTRMVVLIFLLLALAAIEGYLLYSGSYTTPPLPTPEGHEWVYPESGPPYTRPIQK